MRVTPMLDFRPSEIKVTSDGIRLSSPLNKESIEYEIIIDTDESDDRLELLRRNVEKFGTMFNTVIAGVGSMVYFAKGEKSISQIRNFAF
ncbi:hypothetical protein [Allorhodopirellula heiligendammensis]|nr:hypothetical protein [Allorhodopirellula heiligendammensis]